MKHLFSLVIAALCLTCAPQPHLFAQQPASDWTAGTPKSPDGNVLVRYENTGCSGYCPVFKINFLADGTMEYQGGRFSAKTGNHSVRLTADEFSQLQNAVRRSNVWDYPNRLPNPAQDGSLRIFTVYEQNKRHTVKGSGALPESLTALEQVVQSIAEAHGFEVKKGVDPTDLANLTGEISVRFNPGVNVESFCLQFMEFTVRPIRQGSESDVWILGYLPSEITEDLMLQLMGGMEGVTEVKSNKAANDRR
jgi:hypothetical protein